MATRTHLEKRRAVMESRTPLEAELSLAVISARTAIAYLAQHPIPDRNAQAGAIVALVDVIGNCVSAARTAERMARGDA